MTPKSRDDKSADDQECHHDMHGDTPIPLTLKIPPDLYRAYQRCSWIIIHETGRDQLDIMQEMVEDFLIKHGC